MKDIRNVDLNLLVAFDVLYEVGNVSRAAVQMGLSQPAVSGMLARLREVFSDPLFVRTQHGVLPTRRADELSMPIRDIIVSVERLVTGDEFDPATIKKTISISANDYLQEALIIPFIGMLRKKSPGIRLSVTPPLTERLSENLARGRLDLSVSVPELVDPGLPRSILYSERYVCIGRSAHPLKSGKISLKQFCSFDHLIVSPTRGSFSGPTDDALAELGVDRRVVISLPSFQTLLKTVQTDDFLALVPERMLRSFDVGLKVFRPPVQIPNFDVIVCWHQIADKDPVLNWVKSLLHDVAAGLKSQ